MFRTAIAVVAGSAPSGAVDGVTMPGAPKKARHGGHAEEEVWPLPVVGCVAARASMDPRSLTSNCVGAELHNHLFNR